MTEWRSGPATNLLHGDLHDGNREMLSLHLKALPLPQAASLPRAELAMLQGSTTLQLALLQAESDSRRRVQHPCRDLLNTNDGRAYETAAPHGCEQFAQPTDAMSRQRLSRRRLWYCGSCGVEFYNQVRPHSAHGGLTPASIRLPSCSPASTAHPRSSGFRSAIIRSWLTPR